MKEDHPILVLFGSVGSQENFQYDLFYQNMLTFYNRYKWVERKIYQGSKYHMTPVYYWLFFKIKKKLKKNSEPTNYKSDIYSWPPQTTKQSYISEPTYYNISVFAHNFNHLNFTLVISFKYTKLSITYKNKVLLMFMMPWSI